MNTQRHIFVQPRRTVSLAPVYWAILALLCLGLLAMAVAFWPDLGVPSATRPERSEVAPATVAPNPAASRARSVRPATNRGRWV
jgi:hypothetical protein